MIETSPPEYGATLNRAFRAHYEEGSDVWTHDAELRCFPALLQGALKLGRDSRVLDVGCGAGRDTAYFASFAGRCVGIDLVAQADWEEIAAGHPNTLFHELTLAEFTTAERFDLVLDNGCFHHQHPDERSSYLQRIARLLLPGGCFALSTFKSGLQREFLDAKGRLHTYFQDDELAALLEAAGFQPFHQMDIFRKAKKDYYRFTLCNLSS